MNGFCPHCEDESPLELVQSIEEINVRGETIPVQTEYYRCLRCGEEFERILPGERYDPLAAAYEEYRRRKGMVQPFEIREFRKKYGLSQKEFGDLLGIGVATLSRYENGALQEEAHDRLMRFGMDPSNLVQLVEGNSRLSQEKRERLLQKLKREDAPNFWLDALLEWYGSYEANILSGFSRFQPFKFFEAIKFFCFPDGVYKTKLNKLLFYADFKHFKEYGLSITGAKYAHAHHGPVPDQYEAWFFALISHDPALESREVDCNDVSGELLVCKEQPDISVFSAAELAILAQVKDKFHRFSSKAIREFSHDEQGYKETRNGELIAYSYADMLKI